MAQESEQDKYRPEDPFLAFSYNRLVQQGVAPVKALEVVHNSFGEE